MASILSPNPTASNCQQDLTEATLWQYLIMMQNFRTHIFLDHNRWGQNWEDGSECLSIGRNYSICDTPSSLKTGAKESHSHSEIMVLLDFSWDLLHINISTIFHYLIYLDDPRKLQYWVVSSSKTLCIILSLLQGHYSWLTVHTGNQPRIIQACCDAMINYPFLPKDSLTLQLICGRVEDFNK